MTRCPACDREAPGPPGSCSACSPESPGGERTLATLRLDAQGVPAAERPAAPRPDGARRPIAPGTVLGDRYQVLQLLGRGGIGEVWQALDLKLRVTVALKALRGGMPGGERVLERLRREVRSARDVVSPNVCRIFDLVELDGHEVVTMEFVDGITLAELLRERGPLAPGQAIEIASQLLAGLEAIHQAGFVHCDVKPENVMVTRTGRVVVMDFGLARPQAEDRASSIAGTPAYMAPEQLRGTGVDARADLYSAGILLAELIGSSGTRESREPIQRGAREDPPRLPDSPWRPALLRAVAERREARWSSARELSRALEQVALRVDGAERRHPYPGLAAFTAADAEYFFGREQEVEALWHKLGRAQLLAVIGPSGAGKSSFLRAGLLPAMPSGWHAAITTPGTRPFDALARALGQDTGDGAGGGAEPSGAAIPADDPDALLAAVQGWRAGHGAALLVVDQFEELFTLNDEPARGRFAELLARIALEADVHVLLSMRDDFLIRCHDHPALEPVFAELTPLGPPTGAALRRAIVQPALLCGYRFEDEDLVAEMIDAVAREAGALPLLAFAAARLWEERDRAAGLLTRDAYARTGGVAGALARHAEATVERIGSEHLPVVRELFRNLVTAQGTRAVRDYDELLSVFGERRHEAETVLRGLVDARLLTESRERAADRGTPRGGRVEIIHESLLTAWPRLERWRAQDAEGALLRDQLRQAAATWAERGQGADLLWSGTAYEEFSVWHERYPGGLSATEQAFADAMRTHARRRRRRQRTAVTVVIAALVGVIAIVTALRQQSERAKRAAEQETRRAQANALLALGRSELALETTAALAYARKSLELADTPEARHFAVEVLWHGPVARVFTPESVARELQPVERSRWEEAPVFSPDGRVLAVPNSASGRIFLFPSDGAAPRALSRPPDGNAAALAFGPGGDLLVTRGAGSSLRLLALPGLELRRTIELGGAQSNAWVDGDRLLAVTREAPGGASWAVRSWSLPGGEPQDLGRFDAAGAASWAVDRPGRQLALVRDGALALQPLTPGRAAPPQVVGRFPPGSPGIRQFGFTGRGERIFAWDQGGEVRVWPPAGAAAPAPPRVLRTPVTWSAAVVDPGGEYLATYASLWNLRDPPGTEAAAVNEREPRNAVVGTFDAGGRWFVSGSGLNFRFWPLEAPRRRVLPTDGNASYGLEFTPDGRRLVSCMLDRPPRVWPLSDRDGTPHDLQPWVSCWGIAMNPAGTELLVGTYTDPRTGSLDGRVFLYPLGGGPPRQLATGWEGVVGTYAVGFDRDGRRALAIPAIASYYDLAEPKLHVLRSWDLATGRARDDSLRGLTDPAWQGCFEEKLHVAPDGSIYCGGIGGVQRFRLPDAAGGPVTAETVFAASRARMTLSRDGRFALVMANAPPGFNQVFPELHLLELATGHSRRIVTHGDRLTCARFDPTGQVIVTGSWDGTVRVGPVSGGEPHLLLGHPDMISAVAVSPDARWVASAGSGSLVLWPLPDVAKTPLHTLPLDALLAKLDALTNLRVVPDPAGPTGWKLETGPFPGWTDAPTWP
jgi:WD40 repeat protein